MAKISTIYHYTTIEGLVGIIKEKQLWASDCRFLNDGAELSYAQAIFDNEVKKLNLPPIEGGGYRLPSHPPETFGVFITCFCQKSDLLSQWRGYGADQGYSLGFSIAQLRKLDVDIVSQVQYGIKDPQSFFKDELDVAPHPTAHPGNYGFFATERFLPRLALVKHPGFVEEKEWRLLKIMPFFELDGTDTVQFRHSRMGTVGHINIKFPAKCLREILIGPGAYTESRALSVRTLLKCNGLTNVSVKISRIPYRG